MPKQARELTAYQVKRLTRPGLHAVGGVAGLYLTIKTSGARHWLLRGLGGYPTVTLEQAREKARAARTMIEQGTDPVAEKRAARDALRAAAAKHMTFADAAARCWKVKRREFRNPKHAAQWRSTLETY